MKEFTLYVHFDALGDITTKIFENEIFTDFTLSDKEKEAILKLNVNEGCVVHYGHRSSLKGWITRTK